jgi:acetyl-CoA acetyltransferase
MSEVVIAGVGMTHFGRRPGAGAGNMANEATAEALGESGVGAADVQKIYFGNAAAGMVSSQEMVRGEVAFHKTDLAGTPTVNVENACASGSSALQLGWEAVAAGRSEVVLVVGSEQLSHDDKSRTFEALRGSTDIEEIGTTADGDASHSILMEFYAQEARSYLEATGAEVEDFARVAVKNREHAGHNPLAQFRKPQTIEEVLAAREIVEPLSLPMCSPVTDGAAALVLCSADYARSLGAGGVKILASEMAGGARDDSPVVKASAAAYEAAGLGPDDMDAIELHDAAAPAELIQYEEIGLCEPGEGYRLIREGTTTLRGERPVNTSGGLMSRGHPLGATGCAQIVELYTQIRGRAGGRQVEGARTCLAVNAGGWLDGTYAVTVATILQASA